MFYCKYFSFKSHMIPFNNFYCELNLIFVYKFQDCIDHNGLDYLFKKFQVITYLKIYKYLKILYQLVSYLFEIH